MRKPLLIEIGVEELPAIPFLKELPNIKDRWQKILSAHKLEADFEFYFTPRRLVLISDAFLEKQANSIEELFGAPVEIAYKEGKPTPAALGFARKCGISIDEISSSSKNGKEVLYYQKNRIGLASKDLLSSMITEFLKELQFGKSMRWGNGKDNFIRPIRWIGCLFDGKVIEIEVYGIKSDGYTYGHRTQTYDPLKYDSIKNYQEILKEHSVILNPNDRKERILDQFQKIEKDNDLEIEHDRELLKEVVAITEFPTALLGTFDEAFLKLPPEVIIASMKEHQRYFPVFKSGVLSNHFVVVSNADTDDYSQIIKGNEKVLYPRLSDGLFFYNNDLKKGLDNEGLKKVTFMQGLGSIYDKSLREEKIAQYLLKDAAQKESMSRAVMYAKADLLSDMVYEFTELQGLMGYYYAKEAGEDEEIALSFKEQYLPDGEESDLPSSDFSAIVAMSNKLDSILVFFSKGKIPTGTKDPFGLRRAVLGIVKIAIDRGFSFDVNKDLKALSKNYDEIDLELLETFFLERISRYFEANPSVIHAVLKSGERDIVEISKKIEALNLVVEQEQFKDSFSTFKRVANIIKDMKLQDRITVDDKLFKEDAESALFDAYNLVADKEYDTYKAKLDALFGLKSEIDNFFDHVMVNVEDENIKNNRKNLIALIYQNFRNIADIKEITL
ncbi:MAG TPA: glycine--tRNA ligase subunit beta [Campylobacterales bacterium]|nr:glycine--tRNA ligase subunit beta [Campylobacterales bacterium]